MSKDTPDDRKNLRRLRESGEAARANMQAILDRIDVRRQAEEERRERRRRLLRLPLRLVGRS